MWNYLYIEGDRNYEYFWGKIGQQIGMVVKDSNMRTQCGCQAEGMKGKGKHVGKYVGEELLLSTLFSALVQRTM